MTNSKFKREVRALSAKRGIPYQTAQQELWIKRVPRAPEATRTLPSADSPRLPLPAGWHGFGARVVRLIELAEAEASEQREREATHGQDLVAFAFDRGPAYHALLTELQLFDVPDTRKLIALMYSGREGTSLRATHCTLRTDPEFEQSQIFSKRGMALPTYLRRALEDARECEIDLDAPLPDQGLLYALWVAGVSEETLDRWDPAFLSLKRISGGLSADPEVAAQHARENAKRGDYALDLGHASRTLSRETGEVLEGYLLDNGITFDRKNLSARFTAKRAAIRGAHQRHVVECLRWPATFHDQTIQQIWSLAHVAGVTASLTQIRVAAERLAKGYLITQKSEPDSDCFMLTDDQLGYLGGAATPPWATI